MRIVFWLLDVNAEVRNEVPEVWLWGIDEKGERVLVVDRSYLAYFYAVIEEGFDPSNVVEEIKSAKAEYPFVVKTEVVERKFFGKPVKAVKVYCGNPDVTAKYASSFRRFEGIKDCLEDDIRYTMHYLIDNNVVPCGWHEVEVTEEKHGHDVQVDKIFIAESSPRFIEKAEAPALRILAFSTVYYSKEGSPKPERNPVIVISAVSNMGEEKQFVANEDKNDKPLLEAFIKHVGDFDPDLVVGFGTNEGDWHYLTERCKKLGIRLTVNRAETEPHTSVYGHVSLTGRANVDLLDFADEFQEVKVKTLENLADYLGVMKLENHATIEDVDFPDYWDDKNKRDALKKYSMENAKRIMGITDAILDFAMQLSSLVGLPIDQVGAAAVGFRVEWFLIKRAQKIGELAPRRMEQAYRTYTGGLVLRPEPGLHDNIAVLDFKSMYPNIMITYNLSPDTYISPNEPQPPPEDVYEAPEVGYKFRREPAGFYREILSYLIDVRQQIRAKMDTLDSKSGEHRVLDARQKAVKVITNATYGYAGWVGARWYIKPVAEAATAWGRHLIMNTIDMAKREGLKVVYGDTDSIFVKSEAEKVAKLSKEVYRKFGLEINPDKTYVRIFFTEAKKRYAGLLPDGRLDIVGLEVIRGDWAAVAKTVQEKVIEVILKEQSPEKAAKFVRQYIFELRQKKVPFHDLIIWKTLTKPPKKYAVKASHVEAARILAEKGWKLDVGDKVGYVVVIGKGRLYERVRPYILASYDQVDIEYYVSKQVVPAAARILESFGITEEQLSASKVVEKDTRTLADFLQS